MKDVAKSRFGQTGHRVTLSFSRPEDIRLFAWMEKRAYECRYDLATFIVVGLHEAFDHQLPADEPDEVPVRRHTFIPKEQIEEFISDAPQVSFEMIDIAPPAKPVLSDEQLAKQAEDEIAQLDAIAASAMGKRKRTGKIPLPPPV